MMPCNPHIGGSSKGHLVREIDALGGEMARCIDHTFLQSRMLNRSKGPAVHSLRAQADKAAYSSRMRQTLEKQEHLQIRMQEVTEIVTDKDHTLTAVKTVSGTIWHCQAAILCTGTYLNARCIYGDVSVPTGPNATQAANHLTDSLKKNGIEIYRFKTGTPARIDGKTIDYTKMTRQDGDVPVIPFSFETDPDEVQIEQVPVYLTHTNEDTHKILRENLDRSPLFSGKITGTGPRYCPSIEDKVVRFSDKPSHQVFVEPQGRDTEGYVRIPSDSGAVCGGTVQWQFRLRGSRGTGTVCRDERGNEDSRKRAGED